jgi:hypothetical protein
MERWNRRRIAITGTSWPPSKTLALTLACARRTVGIHRKKVYLIPAFLEIPNQAQMAPTRKSCLEAKAFATLCIKIDLFKHQSSGTEGSRFRRERRHTLRNQVCVDEVLAVLIIRQEFPSEGRLAGTVRSRNEVNTWTQDSTSPTAEERQKRPLVGVSQSREVAVPASVVASSQLPENQFAQVRIEFVHSERLAQQERQHAPHRARQQ